MSRLPSNGVYFTPNAAGYGAAALALYNMYKGDSTMHKIARGLFNTATGGASDIAYRSFKWAERLWNNRGKKVSVVDESNKRSSLATTTMYLGTETDTQVIDASETHTVFSIKDIQAAVASAHSTTANDGTTRVYSSAFDRFIIKGSKPFIAVPFLLIAPNGTTWSTTDGTTGDPKTAIEAALGDAEYQLRLYPEILGKPIYLDSSTVFHATFEIRTTDLFNHFISMQVDIDINTISKVVPEIFLGMYVTSNEDSLTIYQWAAQHYFHRSNRF